MKEFTSKIENTTEKGITIDECVKKAQDLIDKNGICLFLFDVKGSKKYSTEDRQKLQIELINLIKDMNIEFDDYFPKNNLATVTREEKGFYLLLGDGSLVAINNSEVIPKITDFINQKLPNVSFHYNVACDGYDQKAMTTIK